MVGALKRDISSEGKRFTCSLASAFQKDSPNDVCRLHSYGPSHDSGGFLEAKMNDRFGIKITFITTDTHKSMRSPFKLHRSRRGQAPWDLQASRRPQPGFKACSCSSIGPGLQLLHQTPRNQSLNAKTTGSTGGFFNLRHVLGDYFVPLIAISGTYLDNLDGNRDLPSLLSCQLEEALGRHTQPF